VNPRKLIAIESVIVGAGVIALLAQAGRIWARWTVVREVRAFNSAALGGSPEAASDAARALATKMPSDHRLSLARARWLLAAGKHEQARAEYSALASRPAGPEVQAAAELGLGATLVSRSSRPSQADVQAAIEAFGRAQAKAARLPDAGALMAAAKLWAGDLAGARAAAESAALLAKTTLPSAEAQATLFCALGCLAVAGGDLAAAAAEYRKASLLAPPSSGPLGSHVAASLSAVEFELATRPGAPGELRARMVKRLAAEGQKALADPSSRASFLRAAVACARSGSGAERQLGTDLLAKAVATRGKDRTPLILRAALAAEELAPLWAKAEAAARAAGASSAAPDPRQLLLEILPGAEKTSPEPARQASAALAEIASAEKRLFEDLKTAASEAASEGGDGLAEALAIGEYLFRWKMRQAELSTGAHERSANELAAAAVVGWVAELLGERMPRTAEAALLLRNAGAVYEGHLDRQKSISFFKRSLDIDERQADLRALLQGGGASVVATYPGTERLQPLVPVIGAEFALPAEVPTLEVCKVEALLGPKGGEPVPVKTAISGTGLWCIPEAGKLPDGLLEARFSVTDPLGRKTEASSTVRIDTSPPEIVRRAPAPGGMIGDRQPLVQVSWNDPGGLDADSVEVILEPVRAESVRQVLVTGGRQKGQRMAEPVKWRAKDPAVKGASGTSGEIVTSPGSELPPGVYRVRVSMRDSFQHLREDAWTFTIE